MQKCKGLGKEKRKHTNKHKNKQTKHSFWRTNIIVPQDITN